jgi:hypothetical protein
MPRFTADERRTKYDASPGILRYLSACTSRRVKGRIGKRQNASSFGNLGKHDSRTSSDAHEGQSHGSSLSEEVPHPRHSIPKTKLATVRKSSIKPPVIKEHKAPLLYNTLFSDKTNGKILFKQSTNDY